VVQEELRALFEVCAVHSQRALAIAESELQMAATHLPVWLPV
jgi:hypothetical protein